MGAQQASGLESGRGRETAVSRLRAAALQWAEARVGKYFKPGFFKERSRLAGEGRFNPD